MTFKEEYISEKENTKKEDLTKTLVSNDAYAVGDMIQQLLNKIEHTRASIMSKW